MTATAPLRADELTRVLKRPNTVLLFATSGSSSTEVTRLSPVALHVCNTLCTHMTLSLVCVISIFLQVLGYILAFQNKLALHFSRVVVAEAYRRRGIAKQLILVRFHHGRHRLLQCPSSPLPFRRHVKG